MKEETKIQSKTILTVLITIVITILVLFLFASAWLLIENPFNIRGIIFYKLGWSSELVQIVPTEKIEAEQSKESINSIPEPTSPLPMTNAQKEAVESFGIDPNSLVITPAMEDCFVEKIGQERVDSIKQGATPSALELLKSSSCLD